MGNIQVVVPAVKQIVHLPEPRERRLVLGGEARMDIDDEVLRMNVAIERAHDVH